MDREQELNKKSMKRRFGIGYECKSDEEFLKIRESILNPQPIPEPLVKVVEYATSKILYEEKRPTLVSTTVSLPIKRQGFSKLKAFLKRKKQTLDLEINR